MSNSEAESERGLARSTSPKEGQEGGGIRQQGRPQGMMVDPAVDRASPYLLIYLMVSHQLFELVILKVVVWIHAVIPVLH